MSIPYRLPAQLPTVSVVIPVKDDAPKLRQCLEAVNRQDPPAHEVIVVDNASTDDSAAVARAFGACVIAEPRIGIGTASSTGYDHATGSVILRLDADSVPDPGSIAAAARAFAADPLLEALTGPAHFNDGPTLLRRPALLVYLVPYYFLTGLALGHVPLFGSNMAFRRNAWLEVRNELHLADWLVHDDVDLSFHLGSRHRIGFCRSMRVGISMRPFTDGQRLLRLRRGFHTIFLHWPEEAPWVRIAGAARRRRLLRPRPRGATPLPPSGADRA
ncbi:glycosyltransferase family 2 protein [Arthrobacter sp. JSM 101049]|uniref:glycosyltransferase n=1 Tax=Arthrobacter sp. JSM 101049 TaxID=929097 RepID=UPI003569E818